MRVRCSRVVVRMDDCRVEGEGRRSLIMTVAVIVTLLHVIVLAHIVIMLVATARRRGRSLLLGELCEVKPTHIDKAVRLNLTTHARHNVGLRVDGAYPTPRLQSRRRVYEVNLV